MNMKTLLIVVLVGSISAVHLFYTGSQISFHVLHQQLFFIPLVLTSFWFGMRAGLFAALVISFLYGPSMIFRHHEEGIHLVVFTQVSLYLSIAFLMGWLSDRQREQQHRLLKGERINTLAKAASTLSFEIRDIVKGIEEIHRQSGGLKEESANDDFLAEADRLKRLLDALGHFTPSLDHSALSSDLNNILEYSASKFQEEAARKRVKIVLEQDETGCPSMVPPESITRIFDSLVSNAIDFSERGEVIILRSIRGGKVCAMEVVDSGPGVSKENEAKLFTTFFTTKPDGYGLSLSSGRKVLRDLGGDLVYETGQKGGAIFRMIIPRETQDKSIEKFANAKLANGTNSPTAE
ncbi:MAG: HAMP domain-containing sensor histidine kinase [Desulforhopalus sp.]